MAEEDWLECVPWDGEESTLPLGGQIRNPRLSIKNFIKSYMVMDSEGEIRESKTPDGIVIDINMNEKLYDSLVSVYGPRAVVIKGYDEGLLDRYEWKEKYLTDGLKLWALRSVFYGK